MSNEDYIREVLITCPDITVGKLKMHIDFIGTKPLSYGIMAEPVDPVITRYLNGDTLERFVFALYSRRAAADDAERIQNSANYARLNEWLALQKKQRKFPDMGDGKDLRVWNPISVAYVQERDEANGPYLYMMQYEIHYYKNIGG